MARDEMNLGSVQTPQDLLVGSRTKREPIEGLPDVRELMAGGMDLDSALDVLHEAVVEKGLSDALKARLQPSERFVLDRLDILIDRVDGRTRRLAEK